MAKHSLFSRTFWLLTVVRAAEWGVPRLPDAVVALLVNLAGRLAWLVNRSGRRAVEANLRVVLGREPAIAEVQAVFHTAVANYLDLLRLPRFVPEDVNGRVEVEGWENLTAALALGKGALVASLHLGNIEAIGYATRARGVALLIPVERLEPAEFLARMIALRERAGFRCVPVGRDALASVRAALASNDVVGVGADRVTLGDGAVVQFCGRPARMPIAAAALAKRTGAPLLPVGNTRLPNGRFRCRIGAPVPLRDQDGRPLSLVELTERLLAALDPFLRENPTQWVVFRRVWDDGCQ